MGGLGSGRRLGHEPRRIVERCFVIDISQILAIGLVPGHQREIVLRGPLIAWEMHALVLIRRTDRYMATLMFDGSMVDGVAHLPIEEPDAPGGCRYFRCPSAGHPADRPVLASKLYWPPGDPNGFACRRCHDLGYWTQAIRRGGRSDFEPLRIGLPRRRRLIQRAGLGWS